MSNFIEVYCIVNRRNVVYWFYENKEEADNFYGKYVLKENGLCIKKCMITVGQIIRIFHELNDNYDINVDFNVGIFDELIGGHPIEIIYKE